MASASPTADRIAREHRDRSGETFERVTGGTRTFGDAIANPWRPATASGRRLHGASHRPAGEHDHGP